MDVVKTVTEIRRENLLHLIEVHGGGSVAALNERLGLARTDATLTQIKNQNSNSGTGKPRGMGDTLARRIEAALDLPTGYMDNVNSYVSPEISERLAQLHRVAEELSPYALDQLIKIGVAFTEPKNGTNGG